MRGVIINHSVQSEMLSSCFLDHCVGFLNLFISIQFFFFLNSGMVPEPSSKMEKEGAIQSVQHDEGHGHRDPIWDAYSPKTRRLRHNECKFVCLFVDMFVCLFVDLFVCLFVYMSLCMLACVHKWLWKLSYDMSIPPRPDAYGTMNVSLFVFLLVCLFFVCISVCVIIACLQGVWKLSLQGHITRWR